VLYCSLTQGGLLFKPYLVTTARILTGARGPTELQRKRVADGSQRRQELAVGLPPCKVRRPRGSHRRLASPKLVGLESTGSADRARLAVCGRPGAPQSECARERRIHPGRTLRLQSVRGLPVR